MFRPPRTRKTTYVPPAESRLTAYQKPAGVVAASVTEEEWTFFMEWVETRNLEKNVFVLALTYWMRVKSNIGAFFVLHKKQIYMTVCLHIALKWLGYDEDKKCNFIEDLRQVGDISTETHQQIEYDILGELCWEL